jgi:hypothetical protein
MMQFSWAESPEGDGSDAKGGDFTTYENLYGISPKSPSSRTRVNKKSNSACQPSAEFRIRYLSAATEERSYAIDSVTQQIADRVHENRGTSHRKIDHDAIFVG